MTLYLTPVVYTYLSQVTQSVMKWKQRRAARGRLVSVEP
jgi:hypothetical protein